MSMAVLLRRASPLRCSLMFLALVMSSKPFSTLPMTRSPSPIVMTNARSPRRRAKPSRFGCWRWILINPAQFLVTVLMPMSIGLEYAEPRGMFMSRSLSMHAVLTSLPAKFLVFTIKSYGDMETFGEARVLRYLLVHGDLCEV